MEYGICSLSIIPVRSKPGHDQELVNQLLFGELYRIEEKQKNWIRIISDFDQYSGWVHQNQHQALTDAQFKAMQKTDTAFAAELIQSINSNSISFPILFGSNLSEYDGMNFKFLKESFIYSGTAVHEKSIEIKKHEFIKKCAMKFLNAPYLWGGRSAFGIDCSGFTQVVFKVGGIHLKRDAWQQAEQGKLIHFLAEANENDVLFFENEEGKIVHTGIFIHENEIIHASGRVRIDMIDHHGIYDRHIKKYTHKLRLIKRML